MKKTKRLNLNRSKIRNLTRAEADEVVGGWTYMCPSAGTDCHSCLDCQPTWQPTCRYAGC